MCSAACFHREVFVSVWWSLRGWVFCVLCRVSLEQRTRWLHYVLFVVRSRARLFAVFSYYGDSSRSVSIVRCFLRLALLWYRHLVGQANEPSRALVWYRSKLRAPSIRTSLMSICSHISRKGKYAPVRDLHPIQRVVRGRDLPKNLVRAFLVRVKCFACSSALMFV